MKTAVALITLAAVLSPLARAADEQGAYVLTANERTLDQIQQLYAEITPVKYSPPAGRFKYLARTAGLLTQGPELRILMLGDSIINDTSRSCFDLLLARRFPKTKITKITSVRGSTGCWWYRENDRLQKYVIAHKPDLVIIGGISQRDDIESICVTISYIRAFSDAEFLLMTGPFGTLDPLDDKQWTAVSDPEHFSDYRKSLEKLARDTACSFCDMQLAWATYVRDSGRPVDFYKRDVVHANGRGEQILGHILLEFLTPPQADR